VLLGLLAGVGLIFLLDYFDTSVHNRRELEAMGLPTIGEIPRHK
jgi:capsular polysaccharide biosynthesis protein